MVADEWKLLCGVIRYLVIINNILNYKESADIKIVSSLSFMCNEKKYMLSGPVIGTVYVGGSGMKSMGRALPSTLISICRQGIVFIQVLLIMRAIIGMNGIIYAQGSS